MKGKYLSDLSLSRCINSMINNARKHAIVKATHIKLRPIILPCICIGVILSGCQYRQDVKVDDSSSTLVSGTVVVRPHSMEIKPDKLLGGIEAGYEGQSGGSDQWLYQYNYVTFDQHDTVAPFNQIRINGPQYVHNTAHLDHGHVAYNLLFKISPHFQLEPAIGLAYDKADIKVTGTTSGTGISTSQNSLGASIGVTPRWKFNSYFSFEGRFRFGVDTDSNYTTLINPAFNLTFGDSISLSAGYAFRKQHFKTTHDASDIYLNFKGPSAALRIAF